MGIPNQNIKIMLDPKEICFSFSKNNEIIKLNEQYADNNNYNKILPYNRTKSTTAKISVVTNNYNDNKDFKNLYKMKEVFNLGKNKKGNNFWKDEDIRISHNKILIKDIPLISKKRFVYGRGSS